jgi:hypothetical protein
VLKDDLPALPQNSIGSGGELLNMRREVVRRTSSGMAKESTAGQVGAMTAKNPVISGRQAEERLVRKPTVDRGRRSEKLDVHL